MTASTGVLDELHRLRTRLPQLTGALAASVDGLVLARDTPDSHAETVAALTAAPRRAGALAVCGWLSWALGRSTHADRYARKALAAEPDHGLASIVRSFVSAAHLPDWAFRRGDAS